MASNGRKILVFGYTYSIIISLCFSSLMNKDTGSKNWDESERSFLYRCKLQNLPGYTLKGGILSDFTPASHLETRELRRKIRRPLQASTKLMVCLEFSWIFLIYMISTFYNW